MSEAWIIDACRTPRGIGKVGKVQGEIELGSNIDVLAHEGKLLRKLSLEKRELLKSDLKNIYSGDIRKMCDGEKCELTY